MSREAPAIARGRAPRSRRRAASLAWVLLALGCTRREPDPRADAEAPPSSLRDHDAAGTQSGDDSPSAETGLSADERAEADAWIRRYRAGEAEMSSNDPRAVFVAPQTLPCEAWPAERPAGFEVELWRDDYEGEPLPHFGLAEERCHFEWASLHLDPPRVNCRTAKAEALDELYATLRAGGFAELRSVEVEPTPHTVGAAMRAHWPGSNCPVYDIAGFRELEGEDGDRFRRLRGAFREAWCDAGPCEAPK